MKIPNSQIKITAISALICGLIAACGPVGEPPKGGSTVFSDHGTPLTEKVNPDTGETHMVAYTPSGDLKVIDEMKDEIQRASKGRNAENNKKLAAAVRNIEVVPFKGTDIVKQDGERPDNLQVTITLDHPFLDTVTFEPKLKIEQGRTMSDEVEPVSQLGKKHKFRLLVRCKDSFCKDSVSYIKVIKGDGETWTSLQAIAGIHHKITNPKVYINIGNRKKLETPELQALYEESQQNNGTINVERSKFQVADGRTNTTVKIYNPKATNESDRLLLEIESDVVDTEAAASEAHGKFKGKDTKVNLVGQNPDNANIAFDLGVFLANAVDASELERKENNPINHQQENEGKTQPIEKDTKETGDSKNTNQPKGNENTGEEDNRQKDTEPKPSNNETAQAESRQNEDAEDEKETQNKNDASAEEALEWLRLVIVEEGSGDAGLGDQDPRLPDLENSIYKIKFDDAHPNTTRAALAFETYRDHPKVKKIIALYSGDNEALRTRYDSGSDGGQVAIKDSINSWVNPKKRMVKYLRNLPNIAPVIDEVFADFDVIPTAANVTFHETVYAITGNYGISTRGAAGEGGAFQFMFDTANYVSDAFNLNLYIRDKGIDDRYYLVPGALLTAGYMSINFNSFKNHDPAFMLMAHNSGPGSPRSAINQSRFKNIPTTLDFADRFRMGIRQSRYYAFGVLAFHFITMDPKGHGFEVKPQSYSIARPKIERTLFNGSRRPPGYEDYVLPQSID